MKKLLLAILFLCNSLSYAQDTFSIVAVDSITGEVGSAGASCIDNAQIAGGAIIISDVHPERGAIHTQAWYYSPNQDNARQRMNEGYSPQEIVDWVVANDVNFTYNGTLYDSSYRQYGVVDFDTLGRPRSAAYTGVNADAYKNHITGPTYAIQGNILLGQHILDSMEARFNNTTGTLACKLMAAMQGANVVGADTRCTSIGKSSKSAFLRVVKPGDVQGSFYLDLNVSSVSGSKDPIDSLQTLFDNEGGCMGAINNIRGNNDLNKVRFFPNPLTAAGTLYLPAELLIHSWSFALIDCLGREARFIKNITASETVISKDNLPHGIYFYRLSNSAGVTTSGKLVVQ